MDTVWFLYGLGMDFCIDFVTILDGICTYFCIGTAWITCGFHGFFMDSIWLYIDCVQILHGLSKVAQGFNDDAHVLDQDQVGRSRELQDDLSNWHKVGTRSAQGQKWQNWSPQAQ